MAAHVDALPKMVSFHALRYGSFAMSVGNACHLYAGAIRRGRSVRTVVGEGFWGWNGSSGQIATAC